MTWLDIEDMYHIRLTQPNGRLVSVEEFFNEVYLKMTPQTFEEMCQLILNNFDEIYESLHKKQLAIAGKTPYNINNNRRIRYDHEHKRILWIT